MAGSTSGTDDVVPPRNADGAIGTLIVADTRLYRDGLAEILRQQQAIRVLGTAAPGEALALARSLCPDVILVDMVMGDGMGTVRALAQDLPEAKILAFAVPEALVLPRQLLCSCSLAVSGGGVFTEKT